MRSRHPGATCTPPGAPGTPATFRHSVRHTAGPGRASKSTARTRARLGRHVDAWQGSNRVQRHASRMPQQKLIIRKTDDSRTTHFDPRPGWNICRQATNRTSRQMSARPRDDAPTRQSTHKVVIRLCRRKVRATSPCAWCQASRRDPDTGAGAAHRPSRAAGVPPRGTRVPTQQKAATPGEPGVAACVLLRPCRARQPGPSAANSGHRDRLPPTGGRTGGCGGGSGRRHGR